MLRIPYSYSSDENVHKLFSKLSEMDISNDENGREQLGKLGIFGAIIPREYGGLGLNSSQYAYLLQNEKLIDWTLPLIAHQNLCAETIISYGSEEQKSLYLPRLASGEIMGAFCLNEKSSGNDLFSMTTEGYINLLDNTYSLQGSKNWVTNGHCANIFIVVTKSQDARFEGSTENLTAFIVDRNDIGVSVGEPYNIEWLPNCEVCDLHLNNVVLPSSRVLYEANGGYKIANYVQNNARYSFGAYMCSIMRMLLGDLSKRGLGISEKNTYIQSMIDDCHTNLYVSESCLFFTTRFADLYEHPEVEMECATVKVTCLNSAIEVFDNYNKILQLSNQPISKKFKNLYTRLHGIQSFMGSNFYIQLYIGGTMIEFSRHNWKIPKYVDTPWMKSKNPKSKGAHDTNPGNSDLPHVIHYSGFQMEITKLFRQFQLQRFYMVKFIKLYQVEPLMYQLAVNSVSQLGEMIYVMLCCTARANTTYGDYEIKHTEKILKKISIEVSEKGQIFQGMMLKEHLIFMKMMCDAIKTASGYPCYDILENRRELKFVPEKKIPIGLMD